MTAPITRALRVAPREPREAMFKSVAALERVVRRLGEVLR